MLKLQNTFHDLGPEFYQEIEPTPVSDPQLFLWNSALATQLGISKAFETDAALYLSGNRRIEGSVPLAQAYAGHQFGGFNPQLGDGRAHLLTELVSPNNEVRDLQLKGSGQTRFSRQGDGRCAIKPAVREFIMSEAMHALGVPTTRALAVVTTGEQLYRGLAEPGAVVARTAKSHIRVGTFQYFAAQGDTDSLAKLLSYSIDRHYPELDQQSSDKALQFLDAVIEQQIETVVDWMRVGFIHGVMNTDNTTISGETIDYGPCAMMGVYDPETVYSSIDENGRYCFGNQPAIMQWNMARLAECLVPLINEEKDEALALLESTIMNITEKYHARYYSMMRAKLGLLDEVASKTTPAVLNEVIDEFLHYLKKNRLDYTRAFVSLMDLLKKQDHSSFDSDWTDKWLSLVQAGDTEKSLSVMQKSNPVVIPRNHHVEDVLQACKASNSSESAIAMLKVILQPYNVVDETISYQDSPLNGDRGYQTFCGT